MTLRIFEIRRGMGIFHAKCVLYQIQDMPGELLVLNAELKPQHSRGKLSDFFRLHPEIQRQSIIYDIVTVSTLIFYRETVSQTVCKH